MSALLVVQKSAIRSRKISTNIDGSIAKVCVQDFKEGFVKISPNTSHSPNLLCVRFPCYECLCCMLVLLPAAAVLRLCSLIRVARFRPVSPMHMAGYHKEAKHLDLTTIYFDKTLLESWYTNLNNNSINVRCDLYRTYSRLSEQPKAEKRTDHKSTRQHGWRERNITFYHQP